MPNDFMKKQPSKSEQMFYELAAHQDRLQQGLWTTSSFVTAMASILNIAPEKIAELLVNGNDKIKEYSDKINAEISRLEKEKKPVDHSHGSAQTHSHAGNSNSTSGDA